MSEILVIGGTRFIGRHIISELVDKGHTITVLTRGNHDNPFDENDKVIHFVGDRTNKSTIKRAKDEVSPEIVIDSVAFFPSDVRDAVNIFSDVDTYIYISSIGAYDHDYILKTERDTPLLPCSDEQATDESFETYGARKAEGDRIIFEAAENGVSAMSIRPSMVYGPHNHLEFVQYWIDKVINNDQLVVPGNGSFLAHRTYVKDIATAVQTLIERGDPGEAYNIGDQNPLTIDQTINLISDTAECDIETTYSSPRDLAQVGLSKLDFPLYMHQPYVMSTDKLSSLGWESTSIEEAMKDTVNYYENNNLSDHEAGPSIEDEMIIMDEITDD